MKIGFKKQTKKIKIFLTKIFYFIGERLFLNFLFTVIVALFVGGFILYRYFFLVENIELNIVETPVFFDEGIYKKVLEEWEARDKEFQEIEFKQYPNPFLLPILPSAPEA